MRQKKDIGDKFVKNTALLAVSGILAKVLGAFYRIPLTKILNTNGMGIYQMVFPLFAFFLVLITSGIPIALTKIVAEKTSGGKHKEAKAYFKYALLILLFFGLFFGVLTAMLSSVFAGAQNIDGGYILYLIIAPMFVFCAISSAIRAFFQGRQNMVPTGISNILEQFTKLAAGLFFAGLLIKRSLIWGVFGALVGVLISELVNFLFLVILYRFKKLEYEDTSSKRVDAGKVYSHLIKTAIPITIASSVMPLVFLIDSFFVVNCLCLFHVARNTATASYGALYGVVNSLINMPVILSAALASAVLPNLSALNEAGEKENAKKKAALAIKLTVLCSAVFAIFFSVFPEKITTFLYGDVISGAEIFLLLSISGISVLLISVQIVLASVLQGSGVFWNQVIALLVGAFFKYLFILICILTSSFNIYVVCVSNLIMQMVMMLINLIKANKIYKFKINIKQFLLFFAAVLITLAFSLFLKRLNLKVSAILNLLISGITVFGVYGVFCLLMFRKELFGKKLK